MKNKLLRIGVAVCALPALLALIAALSPRLSGAVDYKARAYAFITQATALGPVQAATDKLLAANSTYGAYGCAMEVGKTDPAEAVRILIRIGETLARFAAIVVPRNRDASYYQYAQTTVCKSNGFLTKLGATQPEAAMNMTIFVAEFFFNFRPPAGAYRNNYTSLAKQYLLGGSPSAKQFAGLVKDKTRRQTLLLQVETKRKVMGF
jgi:hypothetical protein